MIAKGDTVLKFLSILLAAGLMSPLTSYAQEQQGDVYDPFVDYSEFEEAGSEHSFFPKEAIPCAVVEHIRLHLVQE